MPQSIRMVPFLIIFCVLLIREDGNFVRTCAEMREVLKHLAEDDDSDSSDDDSELDFSDSD
ncbi:hypothetical protein AC578_2251 [Pseudocercospora eumusae]|uniref:Uncharacterized protein n=1 Tax=Pseudocercospora eumusae TaxID=321146 RepID=A0A139GUN8_9PEZI|nr:hypothetical protein AC578_2251 [Pseudocercospora eumusae]